MIDYNRYNKLFSGNACFLVKDDDYDKIKGTFIDYLNKDGFRVSVPQYNTSHANYLFINIKSMIYGGGTNKPVKLTQTIVDENPNNAFTINEFKKIWEIMKNHGYTINTQKLDNSKINYGYSSFLVKCDEQEDFTEYLKSNKFNDIFDVTSKKAHNYDDMRKSINSFEFEDKKVYLVNVNQMTYTNNTELISYYLDKLDDVYISMNEFKTIWDIIEIHKDKSWQINKLKEYAITNYEKERYLPLYLNCEKILELDENNTFALEYESKANIKQQYYQYALKYINKAIDIAPDDYRLYLIRAFTSSLLKNKDETITDINMSYHLSGFNRTKDLILEKEQVEKYLNKKQEEFLSKQDLDKIIEDLENYVKGTVEYENNKIEQGFSRKDILRYEDKLYNLENKAKDLYKKKEFKASLEIYFEILKISQEYRRSIDVRDKYESDKITRKRVNTFDKFNWYNQILLKALYDFNGNFIEFYNKIYDINENNIDAYISKTRLLSEILDIDELLRYTEKLLEKLPSDKRLLDYHENVCLNKDIKEVFKTCHESQDYDTIEEYTNDLVLCIMAYYPGRTMEECIEIVDDDKEFIEQCFKRKEPLDDIAIDLGVYPFG